MIEARGIVKVFGARRVLDGIDLRVGPGQLVALVGPNGAGKTTLVRILATLLRPTAGSVHIGGQDTANAGPRVRRQIGLVAHEPLLYEDLSPDQNLRFFAQLYGLPDAGRRIDDLLDRLGLCARRGEPVRALSRGMQQCLAMARALLHEPSVLLLDEPMSGLDDRAAQTVAALLVERAREGCAILLSTHDMERARTLASDTVMLIHGRAVWRSGSSGSSEQSADRRGIAA